jgi:hypothetical protein
MEGLHMGNDKKRNVTDYGRGNRYQGRQFIAAVEWHESNEAAVIVGPIHGAV